MIEESGTDTSTTLTSQMPYILPVTLSPESAPLLTPGCPTRVAHQLMLRNCHTTSNFYETSTFRILPG
ncbi:hypothetical protein [Nocardia cyriacigeorgica]|uniref:hypothetical protein n=1 Tax=Nocardia cyriacigeorgica TaxID=135487 RepID=UPI002456066A|nr:hypothetical protein [Nocardia cyriacigeorgica]